MFSHLWQYLVEFFFLQWEMLDKVVEKIKTHILCSPTFFQQLHRLWDNAKKCGGAREAINDFTIWRMSATTIWISTHLLLFDSNNGDTNAPQYYVTRTPPVCLHPISQTHTLVIYPTSQTSQSYGRYHEFPSVYFGGSLLTLLLQRHGARWID